MNLANIWVPEFYHDFSVDRTKYEDKSGYKNFEETCLSLIFNDFFGPFLRLAIKKYIVKVH